MTTKTTKTVRKAPAVKKTAPKPAPKKAAPKVEKKTATKKDTAPRVACRCGCGETPKGKKARFIPGHDARLRGILLRAIGAAESENPTSDDIADAKRELSNVPDLAWAWGWAADSHELTKPNGLEKTLGIK